MEFAVLEPQCFQAFCRVREPNTGHCGHEGMKKPDGSERAIFSVGTYFSPEGTLYMSLFLWII